MINRGLMLGGIILCLLGIQLISGEVIISQTDSLYSVGQDIKFDITVSKQTDVSDFLIGKLVCDNTEIEIYKNPLSVVSGEIKIVTISTKLERFLIGNNEGECYFKGEYDNEEGRSQKFEVSKYLEVDLDIDRFVIDPGKNLKVKGNAIKSNGQLLEGYVDVFIEGIDSNSSGVVKNGKFNLSFTIPADTKSGSYSIFARAYDKDSRGEILNDGKSKSVINVNQILKKLDVAIGLQNVDPGKNVSYEVILLDQAGDKVLLDVKTTIFNPNEDVVSEKLVPSGKIVIFETKSHYQEGYWRILAESGDLVKERKFFIQTLRNVEFSVVDDILIIKNAGNVNYNGKVEIDIGGVIEERKVDLKVGESKSFRLVAPDGNYNIKVTDGVMSHEVLNVALTGKAINVADLGGNKGILWIGAGLILIIFLIILIFVVIGKVRKLGRFKMKDKNINNRNKINNTQKISGRIDDGKKELASIVTLKVDKSNFQYNDEINRKMNEGLIIAKQNGAKIYIDGDYRVIIFANSTTGQENNAFTSLKVANEIYKMFNLYNKLNKKVQIRYGIGVNTGEIIVEKKGGKYKISSIANTIANSKRLADKMDMSILMTDSTNKKVLSGIKKERMEKDVWKVKRVIDRDGDSDFIRRFKERQKI